MLLNCADCACNSTTVNCGGCWVSKTLGLTDDAGVLNVTLTYNPGTGRWEFVGDITYPASSTCPGGTAHVSANIDCSSNLFIGVWAMASCCGDSYVDYCPCTVACGASPPDTSGTHNPTVSVTMTRTCSPGFSATGSYTFSGAPNPNARLFGVSPSGSLTVTFTIA